MLSYTSCGTDPSALVWIFCLFIQPFTEDSTAAFMQVEIIVFTFFFLVPQVSSANVQSNTYKSCSHRHIYVREE